jgi:hypothetical protein
MMINNGTSHNKDCNCFAAYRRLGFRKTLFGLMPSARFCSITFGAGVVASQRPITCPKRQLQPER